jgi:hypothetical protein
LGNSILFDDGTNAGIGTATIANYFSRTLTIDGSSSQGIMFRASGTDKGYVYQDGSFIQLGSNTGGVIFKSNDIERVRITSAGLIGMGTSSPAFRLHVVGPTDGVVYVCGSSNAYRAEIAVEGNGQFTGSFVANPSASSTYNGIPTSTVGITTSSTALVFATSNAERMRVLTTGNVIIGGTGSVSNAALTVRPVNGSTGAVISIVANNAGGSNAYLYLECPGVVGGGMYVDRNTSTLRVWQAGDTNGVQLTNNATSWGSFSDERLKTDLVSIDNAIDKIVNIRAVTGRYKTDSVGTSRSFLIAQDVQRVFPEAVEALTDEMGTLTLRYTEIIPVIVKAVQEEDAEVKALRAEVELLKSQIAQFGSN